MVRMAHKWRNGTLLDEALAKHGREFEIVDHLSSQAADATTSYSTGIVAHHTEWLNARP